MSAIGFNNVFTDAAPEKTNEELRTIRSNNPAYKKITNTYDVNTLTIKQYQKHAIIIFKSKKPNIE